MAKKGPNGEAPDGKATKPVAEAIAAITKVVRKHGLDYAQWRYVSKRVKKACDLKPDRKRKALPRVLTSAEFDRFYAVVNKAGDSQHGLMMRLLFYSACRVSELCNAKVEDVDLDECKLRVERGKGDKDRTTMFPPSFSPALRAHIDAHPQNRYLFQTRLNTRYSTRQVQRIVKAYATKAGVTATPHTFRHQALTWLTSVSGLQDREIQLLSGHERRETLQIYQHIGLNADITAKYRESMKKLDI
ncbi:MAG: tyrosine-type recombinase/integrase [Isosphaeraceae bacterium]